MKTRVRKMYAGTWERDDMNEYYMAEADRKKNYAVCYGHLITIQVNHPRTLTITAEYGAGRGLVNATVELEGDRQLFGEGPYSYVRPGDPCVGHAGWYRLHLRDDGMINLYFNGGFPVNGAVGYEIWKRSKNPELLKHGPESAQQPVAPSPVP